MNNLSFSYIENFINRQLEESLNLSKREILLEKKFILQKALGKTYTKFLINKFNSISEIKYKEIENIIYERKKGKPLSYIFGEWDFYGETFYINHHTLTPRPDTELLVDIIIDRFKKKSHLKILDLGTGSGIIGITLANYLDNSQIFLSDISEKSLEIAEKNIYKFKKNINVIKSNWFNSIAEKNFNIIVSNPPYINKKEQHQLTAELKYEPENALFSDDNGLKDIKLICKGAKKFLCANGILIIEHGYDQAEKVYNIFKKNNYHEILQHKDINQKLRVTLGFK